MRICVASASHAMVISKKYEYSSKVDIKELQKWFPSLSRQQDPNVINSGAASFTASLSCKMLVICFPNAGSDESMYTSEGTAMRKIHSPLLEWAAQTSHGEKNAEILAVQLPGRGFRSRERVFTSAQSIAVALLQVLAPLLFPQRADSSTARHVPYAVIGHSLGALLAFEFISLCRDEGFALPIHAFLSSFPSPDTPIHLRPWRVNKHLDDAAFQQECRCWERTNEVIFSKSIWPTLVQQLRAGKLHPIRKVYKIKTQCMNIHICFVIV